MTRASRLLRDHKAHMRAKLSIMDEVEKHSAYLVDALKDYRSVILDWQETLDDFLEFLDADEESVSFDEDFQAATKIASDELKFNKNEEQAFPRYHELLTLFFNEYQRVLDELAEAK